MMAARRSVCNVCSSKLGMAVLDRAVVAVVDWHSKKEQRVRIDAFCSSVKHWLQEAIIDETDE